MQTPGGLDGEHRASGSGMVDDQPVQLLQPRTQHRQRQRRHRVTGFTGAQPDPVTQSDRGYLSSPSPSKWKAWRVGLGSVTSGQETTDGALR